MRIVKKVPAKIEGWADIQKLNDFNRKMKNLPKSWCSKILVKSGFFKFDQNNHKYLSVKHS